MSDDQDNPFDQPEPPRTFQREWIEFLDEIRVALPGVQLLFGFLLAAPFSGRFEAVTGTVHHVYYACFLATTAACIFLIAPSVYHRLHWRHDVRDKEQMLRTCNQMAIIGSGLLAVAMTTAVYIVTYIIADNRVASILSAASGGLICGLWFGVPLMRRRVEHRDESPR